MRRRPPSGGEFRKMAMGSTGIKKYLPYYNVKRPLIGIAFRHHGKLYGSEHFDECFSELVGIVADERAAKQVFLCGHCDPVGKQVLSH